MKKLLVYQIDSFTSEKFKGNPAGVVINADGLNEPQMLMIAREMNNSETAFLFQSDSKEYDGIIRYFTPKVEVPTCGHATIAAMYAKALEENLDSCILRMKTKIGVLPFEILKIENSYNIIMTQGEIFISDPLNNIISKRIKDALGLNDSDMNEDCPVQIASTGHSKVMIGINSREKLNSLSPNLYELIELSKIINCNGYFVFTLDTNEPDIMTLGRMFAPISGINEDPVTGNANGPLGAYLIHNNIVKCENYFEFKGKQGVAMNRPGIVNVKVKIENKKPVLVQISGSAVVIFKTEIEI
jgi:PhzF family phenazine biosynthesis protein